MDNMIRMCKIKRIINTNLFKNSFWLMILQFFNTIIPMITLPYITRVLDTSEYGVFSISLNWILYFQVIVEYGFGLTGARKVAITNEQDKIQKLFNNIITARIGLLTISFVFMNVIAIACRVTIERYICMLILFLVVIATAFQLTWLFQGKQDMKFITIVNAVARTISVILVFIFVRNQEDIYLYCLLYASTHIIASIVSMVIANKKYNLTYKLSKIKSIVEELKEGKPLFISAAMTKIFANIGVTFLDLFATSSTVGIYSAINKISYVLTMFFSPFSQALFPHVSAKCSNGVEVAKKYLIKIAKYIFAFFMVIAVVIVVFRTKLVTVLYGNEYAVYANVLIPLILQFCFGMLNNFIGIQYLVASGNQKIYSRSFSISCIIMVISNLVLGYVWGIYGIAFASLVGEMVLSLCLIHFSKKLSNKGEK